MDKLKYLAGKLGLFIFLKKIFGPLLKKRKLKIFNKEKDGILEDLYSVSQNGGLFFLAFGTYLGAVRNEKIIAGDDDFDLGVFLKDFLYLDNLLKAHRFRVKLKIDTAEGTPVLIKYQKKGVIVDVFVHSSQDGKSVCYDHVDINRSASLLNEVKDTGSVVLYENAFSNFDLEHAILEGKQFPCPKGALYLQEAYGENYIVPDSKWTYTDRSIRKKSVVKGFLSHG